MDIKEYPILLSIISIFSGHKVFAIFAGYMSFLARASLNCAGLRRGEGGFSSLSPTVESAGYYHSSR
jgi:hypothetical protein